MDWRAFLWQHARLMIVAVNVMAALAWWANEASRPSSLHLALAILWSVLTVFWFLAWPAIAAKQRQQR